MFYHTCRRGLLVDHADKHGSSTAVTTRSRWQQLCGLVDPVTFCMSCKSNMITGGADDDERKQDQTERGNCEVV